MKSSPLRTIGKIVASHGLQGEVSVKPWDEDAPWIGQIDKAYVFLRKGPVELKILSARLQGGIVIIQFQNVANREEAEHLIGADVKAFESELPSLGEDEYYADELIGLVVKSQDSGKELGVIEDVLGSAAGDFLEVTADTLPEPLLVPFQAVFVPKIDRENGTVYITGLDNLFGEEAI